MYYKRGTAMKKIVALLLALVMLFALCGCGSKEMSDEEKEKIYQEVAAEKAREDQQALEDSAQDEDEFLQILDVKLKPYSEELYWVDVKFQCLYPTDKHEIYPQKINLEMDFIDHEGVVVNQTYEQFSNVSYGDIAWSFGYMIYKDDRVVDPDEIKTVRFTGYRFFGEGMQVEKFSFKEPFVFQLEELELHTD